MEELESLIRTWSVSSASHITGLWILDGYYENSYLWGQDLGIKRTMTSFPSAILTGMTNPWICFGVEDDILSFLDSETEIWGVLISASLASESSLGCIWIESFWSVFSSVITLVVVFDSLRCLVSVSNDFDFTINESSQVTTGSKSIFCFNSRWMYSDAVLSIYIMRESIQSNRSSYHTTTRVACWWWMTKSNWQIIFHMFS